MVVLGGYWSAYWYNGKIYGSEIARGLDTFELVPSKFLTQNEIDAAKAVQVRELNVQNQEKIVWPATMVTAKAYLDQLERSNALPAAKLAAVKAAVKSGKASGKVSASLEADAATAAPADAKRLLALAEILKKPAA
jgi:hypothetical protein